MAPGAPEGASGGVPLSAAATGTQAAPDEKVGQEDESEKWHDAKEKEEGQPAATVAPVAAAAPAGAAVCPQGKEGTGSKVRLPDRQPGESGVTPDAKVTRSAEPAGAASSEEEAGGLAPMRLNSNFSAAAGQAGPAEGRPEWRQTGSGEWRIAGKGKGKGKRGLKHTIC